MCLICALKPERYRWGGAVVNNIEVIEYMGACTHTHTHKKNIIHIILHWSDCALYSWIV